MSLTAGVVGGAGTTGGELLRLLARHPALRLASVGSTSQAGRPLWHAHPHLRGVLDHRFVPPDEVGDVDVLFSCVPHGESAPQMRSWLGRARIVVDLSADFRLADPAAYEAQYGQPHAAPELLDEAAYGLPELFRDRIRSARLIAGPGCTAAAGMLALVPLVAAGVVEPGRIALDAKVGSSAAGTDPGRSGAHAVRSHVVRPYAPAGHRHVAEIEQAVRAIAGVETRLAYSAHAVDMVRGILQTLHAWTTPGSGVDAALAAYKKFYANEPFVRILAPPGTPRGLPDPRHVAGTNLADLGLATDTHAGALAAFAAIDNLGKGAAGSALQCANIRLGLPETAGLDAVAAYP